MCGNAGMYIMKTKNYVQNYPNNLIIVLLIFLQGSHLSSNEAAGPPSTQYCIPFTVIRQRNETNLKF